MSKYDWQNINNFAFWLAWAYLSLLFWSLAFKAEKKSFSIILACPYLTFDFWTNKLKKTNVNYMLFLAWAYGEIHFWKNKLEQNKYVFGVSMYYSCFCCWHGLDASEIFANGHLKILITPLFSIVFSKKEGLGKKSKTIGKLWVFWFHFVIKNKINGGKLDFKNHRGELARAR